MTETNLKKRRRISPMWIVPLCAAAVAIWLVVKAERGRGPEIIVHFEQAEGLEQGKTAVNFRGVKVGVVKRLEIMKDFRSVAAYIQLERFAADLAREGSTFYIERPVMSLSHGISGLDTLISGNYIVAEAGSGAEKHEFEGLKKVPPPEAAPDTFRIRIRAQKLPPSQDAAPIYYRGIHIGTLGKGEVESGGQSVVLEADIRSEFKHLILQGTRFWPLPLVDISAGPGVVDLKVKSPGTLMKGGLEMDYFGKSTAQAEENSLFDLYATEELARCVGPAFEVFFENAQGLLPEKTMVRYRGYPVGMVQVVDPEPGNRRVKVRAQLFEGYDSLLKDQTAFWLVRPSVTLQGVQGMETIFSGVYLECRPGPGKGRSVFQGMESQPFTSLEGSGNSRFILRTDRSILPANAPIYFRGVEVGRVLGKSLSPDSKSAYLTVEIAAAYRPLIRQNTRFYNVSGIDAYFGFLGIKVRADNIESIASGGLAFATPEVAQMGGPAKDGQIFDLYDKAEPAWLKWSPSIPLEGR